MLFLLTYLEIPLLRNNSLGVFIVYSFSVIVYTFVVFFHLLYGTHFNFFICMHVS